MCECVCVCVQAVWIQRRRKTKIEPLGRRKKNNEQIVLRITCCSLISVQNTSTHGEQEQTTLCASL